jgi:hypothetical protein
VVRIGPPVPPEDGLDFGRSQHRGGFIKTVTPYGEVNVPSFIVASAWRRGHKRGGIDHTMKLIYRWAQGVSYIKWRYL